MKNFLAELESLIECDISDAKANIKMYREDQDLPPEQMIFSDHETIIAVSRAKEAYASNSLARIKRLKKKHFPD